MPWSRSHRRPVGGPITATVVTTTPNGPSDPFGDYQAFTVDVHDHASGRLLDLGRQRHLHDQPGLDDLRHPGQHVGPETLGTFDVETADIGITKYRPDLKRSTNLWTGTIKLTNNGSSSFSGPIFVLFNLPGGVILENATGTYDGEPYLEVAVPGGTLARRRLGQCDSSSSTANVNPASYSTTYYIGSLGS